VADGTLQILGLGSSPVPLDYNVSGNQTLDLIAVKGDFDGSAAAVPWVPVVEILSDAGHVMAQAKGDTVAAGGSATVTFAPFLKGPGGGGADPNAVHYNVPSEHGTFVDSVATTNGYSFWDQSGNGIYLTSEVFPGSTGGFIGLSTGDGETDITSTVIVNRLHPTGGAFEVQDTGGGDLVRVDETGAVWIFIGAAQQLTISGLPVVNPGGSGRVWNNGGVLNIT
jgi:hypothetical protein